MFALDTNILVYAHNAASPFHQKAKMFVEKIIAEEDDFGYLKFAFHCRYAPNLSMCAHDKQSKSHYRYPMQLKKYVATQTSSEYQFSIRKSPN